MGWSLGSCAPTQKKKFNNFLGMDGYPAQPSGSGRFSTNRWNPPRAGLYVALRVGFSRITVPRFAPKSDVTAQLTVAAKICRWSLSIDVAADQVPSSPTARQLMFAFISLCKRPCCYTLCWHLMLHRNTLISTWMTRPASGWHWRFIGQPTSSVVSIYWTLVLVHSTFATVSLVR